MEHEGDVVGALGQEIKKIGNQRKKKDSPGYSIVEISRNTQKSPWRPEEICCHSDSTKQPPAATAVRNLQSVGKKRK